MNTWKILRWDDQPAELESAGVPFTCQCGHEAEIPTGVLIGGKLIAITCDNYFVFDPPWFDPPANWLPTEVQCRKCQARLTTKIDKEEV